MEPPLPRLAGSNGRMRKREEAQDAAKRVFKDQVICTTGLGAAKKATIRRLVLEHGGEFIEAFKSQCTQLVACEATTEKCKAAVLYNVPIVSPGWVETCVNRGCLLDVDDFRIPPLLKVIVCATNFEEAKDKEDIARRVEEMGGAYAPNLDEEITHFLIAAKPGGKKYDAAMNWKIPVVSLSWLEECEKKRACVAPQSFQVKAEADHAPKRNPAPERPRSKHAVSELVLKEAFPSTEPGTDPIEARWQSLPESFALDGHRVFIAGMEKCSEARQAALKGLLHKASGTISTGTHFAVTDVVIAHQDFLTDSNVGQLNKFSTDPQIVSVRWLYDTVASARIMPPKDYPVLSSQVAPPSAEQSRASATMPPPKTRTASTLRRTQTIPAPSSQQKTFRQPFSRDLESLDEVMTADDQTENTAPICPSSPRQSLPASQENGARSDGVPGRKLRGIISKTTPSSKRAFDTTHHIKDFQANGGRSKRRSTLENNLMPLKISESVSLCNPESQLIQYDEDC